MKKSIFMLLFSTFLVFLASNAFAIGGGNSFMNSAVSSNPENTEIHEKPLTKKQLRAKKKLERRTARLEKFFNKRMNKPNNGNIDIKDPVEKWMWFWIFGWGAGLLLSIVATAIVYATLTTGIAGILWLLGSLAWLFGTISLVIWLVKKFG